MNNNENKEQLIKDFADSVAKIKAELHKDIIGQEEVIDDVVIAIIAGGNVYGRSQKRNTVLST